MPLNGYMEIPEEKLSFGLSPEFVGIAAADQVWLNHIIRQHPEWRRCVEIGTSYGLTALFVSICMLAREGDCWTVDIAPPPYVSAITRMWPSNLHVLTLDALPTTGLPAAAIVDVIASGIPTLVIMDGGDKTEEVRRYAPCLQSGSAFVVHDWVSELQPTGQVSWDLIRHVLAQGAGWTPLALDEAERWNCYFRGWEKLS